MILLYVVLLVVLHLTTHVSSALSTSSCETSTTRSECGENTNCFWCDSTKTCKEAGSEDSCNFCMSYNLASVNQSTWYPALTNCNKAKGCKICLPHRLCVADDHYDEICEPSAPNGGFDYGTIDGWEVVNGTAFGENSIVSGATSYNGQSTNIQYVKFMTSLKSSKNPDFTAMGVLRGNTVTLGGNGVVHLRMASGRDEQTHVAIHDAETGVALANVSGDNTFTMQTYHLNISDHIGKKVYVQAVDHSTDKNFGFIFMDGVYVPTGKKDLTPTNPLPESDDQGCDGGICWIFWPKTQTIARKCEVETMKLYCSKADANQATGSCLMKQISGYCAVFEDKCWAIEPAINSYGRCSKKVSPRYCDVCVEAVKWADKLRESAFLAKEVAMRGVAKLIIKSQICEVLAISGVLGAICEGIVALGEYKTIVELGEAIAYAIVEEGLGRAVCSTILKSLCLP